jgi:thymidylate kinase
MGKIITVIGIDGSGKSTLIQKVGNKSFHFYDGLKKKSVGDNNVNENIKYNKKFPNTRFFLGSIIKILIPNLFKFYYYKYFTKSDLLFDRYTFDYLILLEKKKSFYHKILYLLFNYFPSPDFVVFLEIEPQIAFNRKKEFDVLYLTLRQKELKKVISHFDPKKIKTFNSSENINSAYEFCR